MSETWCVLPNVVFAPEADGALLYHPETGEVRVLNETGAFIYQLLDGSRSEIEIVEMVLRHFDVLEPAEARQEVSAFIEELRSAGLLGSLVK